MAGDREPIDKEAAVRAVLEGGEKISAVAARYGITPVSVWRWVKIRQAGGRLPKNRPGRPPLLQASDLELLRQIVSGHPEATAAEIGVLFGEASGKRACYSTIRKGLIAAGCEKKRRGKGPAPAGKNPVQETRYTAAHRREAVRGGKYPSSLTDTEWEALRPLLDPGLRRGRRPVHSRRVMTDALFYIVRTGCQWRMLPADFPPWPSVWSTFHRWRDSGLLLKLYDTLHALWRKAEGRKEQPSAGVLDSQTVKTSEKGGSADMTLERR